MKQRSTTPVSKSFATRACIIAATILTLTLSPLAITPVAKADRYDDQIRAIQSQIDSFNAQAEALKAQGDSYGRELGNLNNQKAQIQAQLDLSIAKANQLTEQIKQNEKKIEDNKSLLGKTIADLYIDDKISPLEMLASSNSIADYVDKQSNREQIQQSVQSTIKEIKALKKELEAQKKAVDQEVANQTFAREQLATKEAEVANLMAQVQGQEASYRTLSEQSRAQKDQVQSQQQAAINAAMRRGGGGNTVAGDPGKGGYPTKWANSNYYSPVVDDWGMYSRQCVSYTAWKVHQASTQGRGRDMPYWGGRGNANQWPDNAQRAGIPVSSKPSAGSVGVLMAGEYGHVVWVESVNSDGTINISQYNSNTNGLGWGNYSEAYNVSPNTYQYYISF